MNAKFRAVSFGGLIGCGFITATQTAKGDGQYCSNNGGGSPYVCVIWSVGANPTPGTDFNFNFSDAANPDVAFKVGDSNWRVWSQEGPSDTDPANLGDLTIDATVSTDDFHVSVYQDYFHNGAVNVQSINLNDTTSWSGNSSVGGSLIGGNVGTITVVKDGNGDGGTANALSIAGDVTGNVTIPHGKGFTIGGKFGTNGTGQDTMTLGDIIEGDVTIGSLEDAVINVTGTISGTSTTNGRLQIKGGTTNYSEIIVDTMGNHAQIRVGYDIEGVATTDVQIEVASSLPLTSKIDLSDAELVSPGGIVLFDGSFHDLAGTIDVAQWNGTLGVDDITGTVHMTDMEDGMLVIFGNVALGTIDIDGDMLGGEIQVNGYVSGPVTIGDDMDGLLDFDGNLTSDIDIGGDMTGTIDVGGYLGARGRVLIDGMTNGPLSFYSETKASSLIHLLGGLDDYGSVTINAGQGNYNANGDIRVGGTSTSQPLPNITYDGCIEVFDNGASGYGKLNGDIDVVGCHASGTNLGITIEQPGGSGTITIEDTDCTNQPGHADCP